MQIRIYEPTKRNNNIFPLLKEMFKDLFSSLGLAKRLFIRDKKAEYRQSVFGVLWAFITPLTNALVWIFLSASGAVSIPGTGIPYPLFVFIGTMLWSIFTESVGMPLQQTTASKSLISKINFPKEAILIAGFYKTMFNTGIKIVILIIALLFFKIGLGLSLIGFLLGIIFLAIFGIAVGLFITPIGLLYTDVGRGIPMILSFFMYLTPVVYKETKIKGLQAFIDLNPLTPIINTLRNFATTGGFDNPTYLLIIVISTFVIGLIGWIFYRVSIPIIVERM
ncbi:Teichoic acid translocation permease protein TagG [compost metagenome]